MQVGGSVLGGALVSGPRDALRAALALMGEHSVGEVLVEAVQPGACYVTCTVLAPSGGAVGAVALPPTALEYWDVEEDIADCALDLERYLASREVGAPARGGGGMAASRTQLGLEWHAAACVRRRAGGVGNPSDTCS